MSVRNSSALLFPGINGEDEAKGVIINLGECCPIVQNQNELIRNAKLTTL